MNGLTEFTVGGEGKEQGYNLGDKEQGYREEAIRSRRGSAIIGSSGKQARRDFLKERSWTNHNQVAGSLVFYCLYILPGR